jgi:hypothetical protein
VYNSFQAMAEKHFGGALMFWASYTWSRSMDEASSFEGMLNPICSLCHRVPSLFDARQPLAINNEWELPFRKYDGVAGKIWNGWTAAGTATFQKGFPIRITSQIDTELMNSYNFETPGEPNRIGKFRRLNPRGPGNFAFDTSVFTDPPLGTIGDSARTLCCGLGINNIDFSFLKNTAVSDRARLQLRAEFINFANHVQFVSPDRKTTDGPQDFGRGKPVRDPRAVQFALKVIF